jgi:NADPH-dependent curcumin reductase CurA
MNTNQIALASRPTGTPTLANFRNEVFKLPEIKEGELQLKCLYYSVDPYMRGRMNDSKSYISAFQIDQPIEGGVVAEVTASKDDHFKVGDLVMGRLPWRVMNVVPSKGLQIVDATIAPASYYLGILGMPGLTAYFGFTDIGKPKAGETVVVSGAAGAVGLVVGQIAKILGCRTIGIAGSDEKTELLKTKFGFDEAINYKATADLNRAIAQSCPNGVDIYFDNVGGNISDAVVSNINVFSRIIVCGQISLYNSTEPPVGPRLQLILLGKSALMQGFTANIYQSRFPEGIQQLTKWIQEGKLKYTETKIKGFDQLPLALIGLFKGENTGKMIVEA